MTIAQAMPKRCPTQLPVLQIVPPGNNVSARNFPKLHPLNAGELHKILKRISIGTPRLRIIDVGKHSISAGTSPRRRKSAVLGSRLERRHRNWKIGMYSCILFYLLLITYFISRRARPIRALFTDSRRGHVRFFKLRPSG